MRPTTFDPSQVKMSNQGRTLRALLPYLWPRGRFDLRARVVLALLLLIAAKITTVYVPMILRQAVDDLSPTGGILVVAPVGLLLAYGLARIMARAFGELRDALSAKVAQSAIRRVALLTFRHVYSLSLRFHLDRQTGPNARHLMVSPEHHKVVEPFLADLREAVASHGNSKGVEARYS